MKIENLRRRGTAGWKWQVVKDGKLITRLTNMEGRGLWETNPDGPGTIQVESEDEFSLPPEMKKARLALARRARAG